MNLNNSCRKYVVLNPQILIFTELNLLHSLAKRLKLTAHNGVVPGSSPGGPTKDINDLRVVIRVSSFLKPSVQ